jgi:hypothetical protein
MERLKERRSRMRRREKKREPSTSKSNSLGDALMVAKWLVEQHTSAGKKSNVWGVAAGLGRGRIVRRRSRRGRSRKRNRRNSSVVRVSFVTACPVTPFQQLRLGAWSLLVLQAQAHRRVPRGLLERTLWGCSGRQDEEEEEECTVDSDGLGKRNSLA